MVDHGVQHGDAGAAGPRVHDQCIVLVLDLPVSPTAATVLSPNQRTEFDLNLGRTSERKSQTVFGQRTIDSSASPQKAPAVGLSGKIPASQSAGTIGKGIGCSGSEPFIWAPPPIDARTIRCRDYA